MKWLNDVKWVERSGVFQHFLTDFEKNYVSDQNREQTKWNLPRIDKLQQNS